MSILSNSPCLTRCSASRPASWLAILICVLTVLSSASGGTIQSVVEERGAPFSIEFKGASSERPVLLIPGLGSPGARHFIMLDAPLIFLERVCHHLSPTGDC
jgi:hypothetical protein